MTHIRRFAAIVCAGILLLPGEGRAARTSEAPQHAAALMFANTLSSDGLAAHMAALQEIADRHGNHREAGSSGYEASAAYLESQLAAAGYRTWRQPFQITRSDDEQVDTFNILAETTSGKEDSVVMLGAHLDSVRDSPGIAAGGLASFGSHEFKTAEEAMMFGGSAGAPYDPNYHGPGDRLDNVDMRPLRLHAQALAYATMRLAQDTSLADQALTPPSNAEAAAGCWPDPMS